MGGGGSINLSRKIGFLRGRRHKRAFKALQYVTLQILVKTQVHYVGQGTGNVIGCLQNLLPGKSQDQYCTASGRRSATRILLYDILTFVEKMLSCFDLLNVSFTKFVLNQVDYSFHHKVNTMC